MFKKPFKLLQYCLLIVAFIGQTLAFAASTPCHDAGKPHQVQSEQSDTSHHDEDVDDCCNEDCCDSECPCVSDACSGAAYLMNITVPVLTNAVSDVSDNSGLSQILAIARIHYRPPIYTS